MKCMMQYSSANFSFKMEHINSAYAVTVKYLNDINQTIIINCFSDIVIFGNHSCNKARVVLEAILKR